MGSPPASHPHSSRTSRTPPGLFTSLEALMGATTHGTLAFDEDNEIARRKEARRRASALRDQKRKEKSARRPKPKFLDFLKHRLGEVVDPKDWRPQWTGYMRGEKQEWWKLISEDTPILRLIKYHEDMVVGCPGKDHRIHLCE